MAHAADKIAAGGTLIFKFDYDAAKKIPPTAYGEVTEKAVWDNLIIFPKKQSSGSGEAGVRCACTLTTRPCPIWPVSPGYP